MDMESDLHVLCDFLLLDHIPRRIRIQEDHIFVYSNDIELFDRIQTLGVCSLCEITSVKLAGIPGVVYLKSSGHAMRTYLRSSRLPAHTARSVRTFFLSQTDVRLSPSLAAWCHNTWLYTQRHYFLDHSSDSTINMLQLIVPGLVKCTLPITTDK